MSFSQGITGNAIFRIGSDASSCTGDSTCEVNNLKTLSGNPAIVGGLYHNLLKLNDGGDEWSMAASGDEFSIRGTHISQPLFTETRLIIDPYRTIIKAGPLQDTRVLKLVKEFNTGAPTNEWFFSLGPSEDLSFHANNLGSIMRLGKGGTKDIEIVGLADSTGGNAYVCVDSRGILFRSINPCI